MYAMHRVCYCAWVGRVGGCPSAWVPGKDPGKGPGKDPGKDVGNGKYLNESQYKFHIKNYLKESQYKSCN